MENDVIGKYQYLWSPGHPYVLVRLTSNSGPVRYTIFNPQSKMALVIEDDEIHSQVVAKMREMGVREVETII